MRLLFCVSLFLFAGCGLSANDDDSVDDDLGCSFSAASWEVDPEGEEGQIHPRSLRVEDTLWTAYNRPDGDANFGVFVAVRSCDGSLLAGPKRLDDGLGNATDPDLVASAGGVLVAWQTDDQGTPWNLSVRTALLDLDGHIVREDERLLMTEDGEDWQGNAWMARLAADSGGYFLTMSRANEATVQFGVALQRLDQDARPVGDALHFGSPDAPAFEPSISVDGGGDVWVSSLEDLAGGGPASLLRVESGTDSPQSQDWPLLDVRTAGVVLAHNSSGLWAVSAQEAASIHLGLLEGESWRADDSSGGLHLAPGLSVAGSEGVVGWAQGAPNTASIHLRAFDPEGWFTEALEISSGPAGAYPADVLMLDSAHAMVTWAEGPSPSFRLHSEILPLR
jgi:hypothetical protein